MAKLTITADYSDGDSTDWQEEFADALDVIAARLRDYDWIMGAEYTIDTSGETIGRWSVVP